MKILLYTLLLLINMSIVNSQEVTNFIEISDNLYVIGDTDGGNVAFLVTKKGVVVVDAGGTPNAGERIVSIIKSVSDKPIKYLILTHFHGDHINGISGFPSSVKIIAHSSLAENYRQFSKDNLNNYVENVLPGYLVNLKLQMGSIKNKKSDEYLAIEKDYEANKVYFENIKNIKFREPDIVFDDYYRFRLSDERIMLEFPGTIALLKILSLGIRQIEEEKVLPAEDVIKRLRERRENT